MRTVRDETRSARTILLFVAVLAAATTSRGQQLHLFASAPGPQEWSAPTEEPLDLGLERFPIEPMEGVAADAGSADTLDGTAETATPPPRRRCVLIQCESLPIAPASKIFTTPVTLWTIAGVLVGIADGIQGPIHYGVHPFHFTDESYFQYWTYGGGSDKVSHFVISATAAGLLYDAYRLNGLSDAQAFGLSFATSVVGGALVEVGDGLTPYGFSAQDWTADALGSLAGVLIKRGHLDDTLNFSLGRWLQVTIPPAITQGRPLFGIDYTQEIYTMNLKLGGFLPRVQANPGFARFFQFSFAYLSKGFGYAPQLDSRYQEVGFEFGLDFQAILKAFGVDDSTWWGDTLQRIFGFLRIPYTQVGAYYNVRNGKWYGPGAPYGYYP